MEIPCFWDDEVFLDAQTALCVQAAVYQIGKQERVLLRSAAEAVAPP